MTFNEVKVRVSNFLRDQKSGNPSDVLNTYFAGIPEESRIGKAEELLTLLVDRTTKPQTREDVIGSGSVGVIVLGLPYAYPLLLTVLGWWVYAVYYTGTAKELTLEEKLALHKRLKDGIYRWDWQGYDARRYDYLLDRLVPPEPSKEQHSQGKAPYGLLRRLKLFFCGS